MAETKEVLFKPVELYNNSLKQKYHMAAQQYFSKLAKDSNTDILLVGAPMFMGREKEEQGKVYVYGLNQVTVTLVEIQENLFVS